MVLTWYFLVHACLHADRFGAIMLLKHGLQLVYGSRWQPLNFERHDQRSLMISPMQMCAPGTGLSPAHALKPCWQQHYQGLCCLGESAHHSLYWFMFLIFIVCCHNYMKQTVP